MSTPPQSRVAFASLIGTTIEFYDFYIYAMATALIIGKIYFPNSDPTAQSLNALLTFSIAFIARPIGAIIFGHIGDQYGRKVTLSASLMLMGGATFMIGALPSYESIGIAAPILLCILRFAQGLGLGGEWGGAALLATEHAPNGKKAWYGMFPQLGPSIGFLLATLTFLALSYWMNESTFNEWGWRLPFLASAVLMLVGLYIRLKITETPVFAKALTEKSTHKMPIKPLFKQHLRPLLLGGFSIIICYHLFYTATVFCLSYGTHTLKIPRTTFLVMLCIAVLGMMITTPISAVLADKYGRRPILIISGLLALLLGFALPDMLANANIIVISIFLFFTLALMGATYAPLGAFLPEQFPVAVRYSGAGLAYQLGGILGASLAPLISQWLVTQGGLTWVGFYMSGAAFVSICAIWFMQETQSNTPY